MYMNLNVWKERKKEQKKTQIKQRRLKHFDVLHSAAVSSGWQSKEPDTLFCYINIKLVLLEKNRQRENPLF